MNGRPFWIAALLALLLATGPGARMTAATAQPAAATHSPSSTAWEPLAHPGALTVREVADRVRPAVVQIVAEQAPIRSLPTGLTDQEIGIGSGVIFDSAGHILTNQHVAAGASRLSIALPDGRTFDGQLVGADPDTDLAVVQIQGTNLPVAVLGDSSQLGVGDQVVAIGNALGLPGGPTVTAGVVSALGAPSRSRQGTTGSRDRTCTT